MNKLLLLFFQLLVFFLIFPKNILCETISINAVGDIWINKRVVNEVNKSKVDIKLNGDIVFANFEGVISEKISKENHFGMPLTTLNILKEIGFTHLSLANNHVLDFGEKDYLITQKTLIDNGFNIAGLNDNGVVVKIRKITVRFISFSFSGKNNVNDIEKACKIISGFKEDIIIVSAHMGGENAEGFKIGGGMEFYVNEKRGDVVKFSRKVIDAGADLVLGHGPHVMREIELYKKKLIIYSLGNFIFDVKGLKKGALIPSYSIKINLKKNGDFKSAEIKSYLIINSFPVSDPLSRSYKWIKKLSKNNSLEFINNKIIPREEK